MSKNKSSLTEQNVIAAAFVAGEKSTSVMLVSAASPPSRKRILGLQNNGITLTTINNTPVSQYPDFAEKLRELKVREYDSFTEYSEERDGEDHYKFAKSIGQSADEVYLEAGIIDETWEGIALRRVESIDMEAEENPLPGLIERAKEIDFEDFNRTFTRNIRRYTPSQYKGDLEERPFAFVNKDGQLVPVVSWVEIWPKADLSEDTESVLMRQEDNEFIAVSNIFVESDGEIEFMKANRKKVSAHALFFENELIINESGLVLADNREEYDYDAFNSGTKIDENGQAQATRARKPKTAKK